jgi:hypothetical protein
MKEFRCSLPLIIIVWLGVSAHQLGSCNGFTVNLVSQRSNNNNNKLYQSTAFRRIPSTQKSTKQDDDEEEDDLFSYFDPLLSPHAYPNGIQPKQEQQQQAPREVEKKNRPKAELSIFPKVSSSKSALIDADVFDPTLSPHAYSNGTPNRIVGDVTTNNNNNNDEYTNAKKKTIGILLMDHGSKSPAANQRLLDLAELYQQSVHQHQHTSSAEHYSMIVAAAHMELASPSIQDGIESLLKANVDEIICHPYFLSPGRHVKEDIPQLVQAAIETLNVQIPVTTTDPIGSNTDLMIQAIDGLVRRASRIIT